MTEEDVKKYLNLASDVMDINKNNVWINHDKKADVVYINFKKHSDPDDSELTDDDIIVRYEEGEIVGLTINVGMREAIKNVLIKRKRYMGIL